MKVIYIMGWGRSGSTLLDMLLGEIEGFLSAGEMRYLWNHYRKGRPCGCGRAIDRCPLWRPVMERVLESDSPAHDELVRLGRTQQEALRLRHLPRLLWLDRIPSTECALAHYARTLSATYRAVADASGSEVVVDSSKRPVDAALLRLMNGVEGYLLHLVRDPRAVAYSWQRARPQRDRAADMDRFSTASSTANWTAWNVMAEIVAARHGASRCIRVRYEDLVDDPTSVLRSVLATVGCDGASDPEIVESRAALSENHTVAGNPRRFDIGTTEIARDDEWITSQKRRHRWTATAIAAPLLRHYGYSARIERGTST